tara:strand:- start:236 stop:583 length:348 start_codon:yes stop_codon:yes gene_type:complete
MNTLRGEFELNILDKREKCLLTLNALRMFSQAEKIKLDEFDKYMQEDPLTAMPMLAYYGYLNARVKAQAKGKSVSKELFISEVLDENSIEDLTDNIAAAMDNGLSEKKGNVKGAK